MAVTGSTTGTGPLPGAEAGRAERARLPRRSLALLAEDDARRDPLEVMLDENRTRIAELLPIRHARMLASPFAFFRGAAAVMAGDLAAGPRSALTVQLCGDAHLANFGGFAAPDRTMVFDLNDFDETIPGPFEWDLRRLAASIAIAGRDRDFPPGLRRDLVKGCVRSYAQAMASFAQMSRLDVWYERLDVARLKERWGPAIGELAVRRVDKVVSKARARTSSKAFSRYAERGADGRLRLVRQPPLLVPLEDLVDARGFATAMDRVHGMLESYRGRLLHERRWLLDGYRLVGVSRKVVGVGSVGTRCWVVLMAAHDDDQDCLVLQVKEAGASALDPYLGTNVHEAQGERVVAGQRIMQATGDVLLGWARVEGLDGEVRDFYVRQLWDWKLSPDLSRMRPETYRAYAEMCGWTLARAHARSGDRKAIAGYLGGGRTAADALAVFAEAYADRNERDHARLLRAVADGLIEVDDTAG
jgi:uncharacterized protein (DUF2252 family)